MEQDTYYVIGRTAFGTLQLWGEKSGDSIKVVTPHGMILPYDRTHNVLDRGADRQIQLFFSAASQNEFELRDESGNPLFDRALAALGPLDHDTLYGFVPALALGGKAELKNLQKLDAHVHLDILSQMTERQIMRDIGKDARDAGLM
jgi:hypothetical protein